MKKRYKLNIKQFAFFITVAAAIAWAGWICVDIIRNPAVYLTTF